MIFRLSLFIARLNSRHFAPRLFEFLLRFLARLLLVFMVLIFSNAWSVSGLVPRLALVVGLYAGIVGFQGIKRASKAS